MAKVTLSIAEMNLVTQQDFILTKNKIIEKVYTLFGNVNEFYKMKFEKQYFLPKEIFTASAKISRGENYQQLPWVMLDYPRYFKGNDTVAIRTFFWWGHFVSIHFLVQGKYVLPVKNILITLAENGEIAENFDIFNEQKNHNATWFLCKHHTPWQHSFEADNYLPLHLFTQQQIKSLSFIKLAKKIPLQEWDNIEVFLQSSFLELLQLIKNASFPNDETTL